MRRNFREQGPTRATTRKPKQVSTCKAPVSPCGWKEAGHEPSRERPERPSFVPGVEHPGCVEAVLTDSGSSLEAWEGPGSGKSLP